MGVAANDDRPRQRWRRLVLILSLGLNLVILGLFGGHELSRFLHGPPPPVRELGFGPFTRALSPEDRKALLREFMRQSKGFVEQRRQMRDDFRALIAALKADPYQPSVTAAIMARQQVRTEQWLVLGQSLLQQRLTAMSAADRSALADRLREGFDRHRRPPRPERDRNGAGQPARDAPGGG